MGAWQTIARLQDSSPAASDNTVLVMSMLTVRMCTCCCCSQGSREVNTAAANIHAFCVMSLLTVLMGVAFVLLCSQGITGGEHRVQ
jgi:hypothetical protein